MLIFWISITLICVFTLWILWRPLSSHSVLEMESVQQRNIAIANERAKEISSALETGDIDQSEHDQAIRDLAVSLADELAGSHELKDQFSQGSGSSTWFVLAMIPLLAYGSYTLTNNYHPEARKITEAASFAEMLRHLEQVVRSNPEDQQGLLLLAQAYSRMERYSESAEAYKKLIQFSEPNADLLVNYVDTSAMANGRRFNEEYAAILNYALSLKPDHLSGLWLSGLVEEQLNRPEQALRRWLDARPLVASDPGVSRELELLIDDVSAALGPRATAVKAEYTQAKPNKPLTAGISVAVSLAPDLFTRANREDTVFIYARAQDGPPMPLAVLKKSVSDLPIEVSLDDSLSMLPGRQLSDFETVLVGARVSKSGQPIPQTGDLESELVKTTMRSGEQVKLTIRRIIP